MQTLFFFLPFFFFQYASRTPRVLPDTLIDAISE